MSVPRPLPPRPSLEFEHKEAKALLRRLRAGDSDALARARAKHPAVDASARIQLSDAQLVIAREYGFASWPKLVRYFGDLDRQRHAEPTDRPVGLDFYEGSVRSLLAHYRDPGGLSWRMLAAYVPRFYGLRPHNIAAIELTEDEARLAVARENGCANWEQLLEHAATEGTHRPGEWDVDPIRYASEAMQAADLDELQRVVEAHPDLLHPSPYDAAKGRTLLSSVFYSERKNGRAAMRPIIDWLASQGLDLQTELNVRLCGRGHMETERVRELLERGADPNWLAPNGIPVLEHALLRYWNSEAVDLVAARAIPRKALWIAAGLGDVEGVRRSLDRNGKPTPAARRLRPDFDAVGGPIGFPPHPEPTDEEILIEAFAVAMLNNRIAVLEYMVSRGFSVNSLVWEFPLITFAVGNQMTDVVECLVRCGADLDLRGLVPEQTAREIAREMFENASDPASWRRIVEICGMNPDAILAERDARSVDPPAVEPPVMQAIELAGDDAARLGQTDIRPENLLFGLLRIGGLPLLFFTRVSQMDLDRFRVDMSDRIHPADDRIERPPFPLHPDAQAVVQRAMTIATDRRRESMTVLHLLYALVVNDNGAIDELLRRYGSSAAVLGEHLQRSV